MAMVADGRSGLNPNAPVFVPNAAYSEVEDFSPEWWDLVKTSPWFREYWLSQHEEDDFTGIVDDYYILDLDDFGADDDQSVESKEHFDPKSKFKTKNLIDVVLEFKSAQFKDLNWYELRKGKGPKAKFREKPAKYASPRCTARRIHQPR